MPYTNQYGSGRGTRNLPKKASGYVWEEGTTQQRPSTLYSYIEIPTHSTLKFTLTSTTANDYNVRLNFCRNLSTSQEDYEYRKYLRNTFNKDV